MSLVNALPLTLIITHGRKKKKTKRIPSVRETRRMNRFAICGHLGHNKSTCPSRTTTLEIETAQARRHEKVKIDPPTIVE